MAVGGAAAALVIVLVVSVVNVVIELHLNSFQFCPRRPLSTGFFVYFACDRNMSIGIHLFLVRKSSNFMLFVLFLFFVFFIFSSSANYFLWFKQWMLVTFPHTNTDFMRPK